MVRMDTCVLYEGERCGSDESSWHNNMDGEENILTSTICFRGLVNYATSR